MLTPGQCRVLSLNLLTKGSISKRKRRTRFKWNITSSVPENMDTLEEEECEDSLTVQSASYRKLRPLSISSDNSGVAIEDADLRH